MRKHLELKAWLLLILFISEIFSPMHLLALGSGPSQPEMATFTPAGTTEMVDPFTGDFSYNIPLMDVEGYPVNIAYNSGITMEQEASWVGLGWNLNVGTVNRSVRGLPDDFKGENIEKQVHMKPMTIRKAGFNIGTSDGLEIFGLKASEAVGVGLNGSLGFVHNNYKGFGLERGVSLSASFGKYIGPTASIGANTSTLDGTSVNASLGLRINTVDPDKSESGPSFGGSFGSGYNTRTGQTINSFGTTAGYSIDKKVSKTRTNQNFSSSVVSSTTVPIAMNSYTPYAATRYATRATSFQGTVGTEVLGINANMGVYGSETVQEIEETTQLTPAYGFFYSEKAPTAAMKDFNRDREVQLNNTTTNLSPINFTYDVFSVSGQGVGGSFRPFRNDIGVLNDPAYKTTSSSSDSYGGEIGPGSYFHGGFNYTFMNTKSEYGPWDHTTISQYQFQEREPFSDYENLYLKAAGERTTADLAHFEASGGYDAIAFQLSGKQLVEGIKKADGTILSQLEQKDKLKRAKRAKLFSYLTAEEAQHAALEPIKSTIGAFYQGGYQVSTLPRVDGKRKAHHLSEITQTTENGERYVYGIPAYNNSKQEVVYTTAAKSPQLGNRRVNYLGSEASLGNKAGVDEFYSSTNTPAYAHSFLLTSKQSVDYQDVTGDGVSPDDLGNAYKFSYQKTSDAYGWRTPYVGATFMEGYKSNNLDQRASFTYGSKEMWYMHSIQSKNQIAEFYISPREDAYGTDGRDGGLPSNLDDPTHQSFKLDSIVLYNKLDRLKNKTQAIPIQKVNFTYDYSLCVGVENSRNGGGKLTLKKIETTYGRSPKGAASPYTFSYSTTNPNYNGDYLDRWGNYKLLQHNPGGMNNNDYPYVLQNTNDSLANAWASAWNLDEIRMPSGGVIQVEYEADDYGYVQHKEATQMYAVAGAGKSDAFKADGKLYDCEYLYIHKPTDWQVSSNEEVKKRLLGSINGMNNMYFRFLTTITYPEYTQHIGSPKMEYASGYTNAIDAGVCSDNPNFLYIKIQKDAPSPISKTAWAYFRNNLFDVLTNQPTVNDSGLESVLKGMVANATEIVRFLGGGDLEKQLKNRGIANKFAKESSFIRLNSWNKKKRGGGSRVKRIVLNDAWNEMVGEGESASYGQEYSYTTTDEEGNIISSGVASYEPLIGNDENPFRTPVPYIAAAANGKIPAIKAFQETPFGESFFPGARVGYSEVQVRNIHKDIGKTSTATTEYLFYTAKDFPVLVKEVPIAKVDRPAKPTRFSYPGNNQTLRATYNASQGYSIILNDMHGKPKSTISYTDGVDVNGEYLRTNLGGTKYNYHYKDIPEGKMLDNEVEVLTEEGYVKKQLLGLEYDLAIDSRSSYNESKTKIDQFNLDIISIPTPIPVPVPIPTLHRSSLKEIESVQTVCVTKVIQQYGLLESVETFTDQYASTVQNKLYDATTGEVLLTERVNEHNQKEFSYTVPAYSVNSLEQMGPAYENTGLKSFFEMDVDPTCNPNGNAFVNSGKLANGDELLVYPHSTGATPFKAWVHVPNRKAADRSACEPTPPLLPRKRLLTAWYDAYGAVCGDSIIPDPTAFLKGEEGEMQSEVKVYHLKSTLADKIINLKSNYVDFYGDTTAISSDIAPFLLPQVYYSASHTDFCNDFSTYQGAPTIFSAGRDLNYNIDNINAHHIPDLFDLTDPIDAELEYIEAYQSKVNVANPTHPANYIHHYKKAYNACLDPVFNTDLVSRNALSFLPDSTNVYGERVERSEKFYAPYIHNIRSWKFSGSNSAFNKFGVYAGNAYKWNTVTEQDMSNYHVEAPDMTDYPQLYLTPANELFLQSYYKAPHYAFERKKATSSRSTFRIKYDPTTDQHLDKYLDSTQVFLINYKVELADGSIVDRYYIEKGRGLQENESTPFYEDQNLSSCRYDDVPYTYNVWEHETFDTTNALQYCYDNYYLLNSNGDTLSGLTEQDEFLVIRSGNDNRLMEPAGAILSATNPLNIDAEGKLLGLKEAGDANFKVYQTTANTFKENHEVQSLYEGNKNRFLSGADGVFRPDSMLRYEAARHQKAGVETSKDGYFEQLPQLWSKCGEFTYAPDFEGAQQSSSGWRLTEEILQYDQNGQAIEASNSLAISSAVLSNYWGNTEAVAANSKHRNVAVDNFEQYYKFGTATAMPKASFRAVSTQGAAVQEELLNAGGETYRYEHYPSLNKIVEGIAHSGQHALFLKGENPNNASRVQFSIDESKHTPLVHELLGETPETTPQADYDLNYDDELTANLTAFKQGKKAEVVASIDAIIANGSNGHFFSLQPGQSNANFQPENGTYWFSVWVKEPLASGKAYAGLSPQVQIIANNDTVVLKASGPAIEGWQKIEGSFTYADNALLKVSFSGGLWGAFYDDMRIHPYQSNMNTYLFDPWSNRLKATLDENNYATFYEYDEEGIPAQLKRETDDGVITISETRQAQYQH